jgi:hypothetical protein
MAFKLAANYLALIQLAPIRLSCPAIERTRRISPAGALETAPAARS